MTETTGTTDEAPSADQSPAGDEDAESREAPATAGSTFRDLPPVTERDLAARARGLSSAFIEGGEDPDLAETRRREARYRRLLIGMIVLIVGLGLIVTIVGLFVPGVG